MSAASVIGREDELGDIEAFLAEVENGPRVLVLSGEPGIGKTSSGRQASEEPESVSARS